MLLILCSRFSYLDSNGINSTERTSSNISSINYTSLYFTIPHRCFNVNVFQITVSYIDSSRGIYSRYGCEDVYDCRACDCLWCVGFCSVWSDLLAHNYPIMQENTHEYCKNTSVGYLMDVFLLRIYILFFKLRDMYCIINKKTHEEAT